jgi:hypothetical protein
MANVYYQQFVKLFLDNNGSFSEINEPPVAVNDSVSVEKNGTVTVDVLANDQIQGSAEVSIEMEAKYGRTYIPFTNPNAIAYQAQNDFTGTDSIQYRVTYTTEPDLYDFATIIIEVGTNSVKFNVEERTLALFPNPAKNFVFVSSKSPFVKYSLYDVTGSLVSARKLEAANQHRIDLSVLGSGSYFLSVEHANGDIEIGKVIVE